MLVRQEEDGAHRFHRDALADSFLAKSLQPPKQIPFLFYVYFNVKYTACSIHLKGIIKKTPDQKKYV